MAKLAVRILLAPPRFTFAVDTPSDANLSDFSDFANQQLEPCHTPGASIAIVRGKELLLANLPDRPRVSIQFIPDETSAVTKVAFSSSSDTLAAKRIAK